MKSNAMLIVNSYWKLLSHLNSDVKLRLIAKLSGSLVTSSVGEKENWADEFYGAWEDSCSAEEIIENIRGSRVFNKNIASFND